MRSPSLYVLLLFALLVFTPAILAHDVTISGTQTFASLDGSSSDHDGSVNGVFTVNDGNLVVNGTVNCNDEGINSNSGCPMAFAVSGNMTVNSGGALYAENRTAGGNGGAITLTVGGNLALNGTAIVSAASTSGNGTNGGAISVTVTGTVTLASGTTIDAGSANATGGNITISAGSVVSIDGNVYSGPSRTLLSTRLTGAALDGGKNYQIGGTITISSTTYVEPAIVISANANVISQGDQNGTGGVTIDGCGVEVRGLVAALSLKESAAKVTIRSGKSLLVDSRDLGGSGTRMGRVRADAPTGSAVNKGVDLFAREDIQILGASTSGSLFAVSSIPGSSKSDGGLIRVLSTEDAITASAKAIDAGHTLAGDRGGTVEISAKDDVNFDTAVVDASGDYSSSNSNRAGGSISVRSYSGDVTWTNGSGDVRPLGSTSGIALADQGTIVLTACGTVDTTGSTYPVNGTATSVFPETHTGTCSPAAPSLPSGVSALMTCNTPPVANDLTPSTNEDNTITITLSGTDADGDSLTFSIVSGPSHGGLGTITSTGPTTATVDYTPSLNYNGSDSFVYQANDGNGGTDNANASISIVAVNDPPTFTIGSPVTVLEDSGASTYTSWITSISAGPTTDETSSQTVSFNVTNDNNALFSVQPAVNSSGTLTFTLAANANGSATITVEAQDSGGIANGGDDTSNPQTSSVTVTAVNDAPSFTCGVNVIADSNSGAYSQANWASAISAGPADESGQTLTFEITANSNSAIFSVQPAVSSGGTLTFTPVAGASGSSNITIRLRDGGGTANGGVDVSASCSFTITVDAAPFVSSTSPVNGAGPLASNVNIVITYSEPVTASGTAYTVKCTPSNTSRPFVLSGNGTAVHTLDPNTNLSAGQTCTVTVLAAQITDVDADDPPDTMAANYSFSFSVDANPQITATSPSDGATNVATNANQNITWTEAVTMTSVNINCATSGAHTSTLSTSDSITWTVNPDTDYAQGELCTIEVLSATVTDNDTNDPPDNPGPDISWQFTTDAQPSVTATSPTNGAGPLASNINIVITYSEPVTASGTAYTIQCNTNRTFTLSGNGTATHTLDPNTNLPAGQNCTVTVIAAQISDTDAGDPPDNLAANYSFTFSVDANPQITATSPNDGATNVATNANHSITWTEPVTMTSVSISCANSGSHTSTLSTSDSITWTVDPDTDYASGELCTMTVFSATVTDNDTNDPPDNPGPDISWQYTTDAAPSVTATSPANGAGPLASNTNIVITYDEPVTASGTAYTIQCNTSRTFTLSGNGTAVHTLDPNTNLPAGQNCTVAVIAAQISDTDAGDPPDNLAANYSFTFSVDVNPQIQSTSPTDGSTIAANANITINFTESVTLTAVGINCTVSGSHTNVVSASPATSFTVDPDVDFTSGETCTFQVLSANVTDTDTNDPPDNMGPDVSWEYTVDAAPSVTATTPANGATNLAQDTNIVITYSEPVTAGSTAYTITCPTNRTYVLSGNGTATHTLDPTTNMTAGQTCTVTVVASQITDTDANDPPDNMTANYVFTFSVDANPQIQSTSPNDGSTNVATSSNITITFTESVTLTAVGISCATSGSHTNVISASPAVTFTVNPDVDFSPNELCTITVLGSSVTDTDTNDPPDLMGPNVSWQFTTAP